VTRRTKIVATLGPATDQPGVLEDMMDSGFDCARINCSHSDRQQLISRATIFRKKALEARKAIALLFDLQGPKLRLAEDTDTNHLNFHQRVLVQGKEERVSENVDHTALVVIKADIHSSNQLVTRNSEIIIGDGSPRIKVVSVEEEGVYGVVVEPGEISSRKGIAVTHANPQKEVSLTEKDLEDLDTAVEVGADFIALSFVRDVSDVIEVRQLLKQRRSPARVIAKIEKLQAIDNLEDICQAADGVLVARGDYGVEAGLAEVPLMQKQVIRQARKSGALVITATQMLESMIHSPIPTRAETSDVANAVLDGTSAVMLSGETAVGDYPVNAINTLNSVIRTTERHESAYLQDTEKSTKHSSRREDAVMRGAISLADQVGAKAIIIPTESGRTARACSRFHPRQKILALSPYQRVIDQLAIEWGIRGAKFTPAESLEDTIQQALKLGSSQLALSPGDQVVISAGSIAGKSHSTNLITLQDV
jgi:pyruvate kinase